MPVTDMYLGVPKGKDSYVGPLICVVKELTSRDGRTGGMKHRVSATVTKRTAFSSDIGRK